MVLLTFFASELSTSHVALTALLFSAVAYALLAPSRAARFAAKHGDVEMPAVKEPPRMPITIPALLRLGHLLIHPEETPEIVLRAALLFDGKPWLRSVPILADVVMVSLPAHIEDVVKTQQAVFVKSKLMREITEQTLGDAFFTLEGAAWFHQRKIAQRFFSPRTYRDVATTTIQRHAERLFSVLDDAATTSSVVDFSRLLHRFTFQTFADLGFGLKSDAFNQCEPHRLEQVLDESFSQTMYRVIVPRWFWKTQRYLNIGSERQAAQRASEIRRIVNGLVAKSIEVSQQQKHESEAQNLVELFIHAMREDELPFSPELLCDLAVMFMIAGRDTTAGTLVWILYAFGKYPHVVERIRKELWEKVPKFMDGTTETLTMEQAHGLTFLEAAIKETMRLYPIVPLTLREAAEDTVLSDGTFIAKDTIVGLSPYVTGRLPSVWGEDVLEFKPERFLDEQTGKLRIISAFQFSGFLAGPRICIGMNLAMLEMKLVLAGLLRRFHLDILPNDGSYSLSALMPLKNPLLARVRSVNTTAAAC